MRRECLGSFFIATGSRPRHSAWLVRDARDVMHGTIANYQFPLKSVVGIASPAFLAHAQLAMLRIWKEAHDDGDGCDGHDGWVIDEGDDLFEVAWEDAVSGCWGRPTRVIIMFW